MAEQSIELFFSYAHEDEPFKDELLKHLRILQRQGVISTWHDRMILPGSDWAKDINQYLGTADIILLLVSPDFLNSDYCWGVEVAKAMQRHEAGEACVIPVILRVCNWKRAPFAKLQALPKNAEPIKKCADQDEAFDNVAQGIESAIADLLQERKRKQAAKAQASLHRFLVHTTKQDESHGEGQPRLAGTCSRFTDAEDLLSDNLRSERGVDYTWLRDLLRAKQWQEADYETYRVMLEVAGRPTQAFLRVEDIKNFPCSDLRMIDQLWVKFSSGLFGFSVQKQIYIETGNLLDGQYHEGSWERFCDRIGWKDGVYTSIDEITYHTSSPRGHLPYRALANVEGMSILDIWRGGSLLSRRDL